MDERGREALTRHGRRMDPRGGKAPTIAGNHKDLVSGTNSVVIEACTFSL